MQAREVMVQAAVATAMVAVVKELAEEVMAQAAGVMVGAVGKLELRTSGSTSLTAC